MKELERTLDAVSLGAFRGGFHGPILLPDDPGYGHYVNDMVETGQAVVGAIDGDGKYERLVSLKRAYDPDNVFRLNQNIVP